MLGCMLAGCSTGLKREPVQPPPGSSKKLEPRENSIFSTTPLHRPKVLVLPPDVVSSDALEESIAGAEAERSGAEARGVLPALPESTLAKVVVADGRRRLEVAADAQVVWDIFTQFWANNEIELTEFEPTAGLMQTDWIDVEGHARRNENSPINLVRQLFGQVIATNTRYDRYRIRLERAGQDQTYAYVSHEATRRIEDPGTRKKIGESKWVSEDEDPEAVASMLQTLQQLFQE